MKQVDYVVNRIITEETPAQTSTPAPAPTPAPQSKVTQKATPVQKVQPQPQSEKEPVLKRVFKQASSDSNVEAMIASCKGVYVYRTRGLKDYEIILKTPGETITLTEEMPLADADDLVDKLSNDLKTGKIDCTKLPDDLSELLLLIPAALLLRKLLKKKKKKKPTKDETDNKKTKKRSWVDPEDERKIKRREAIKQKHAEERRKRQEERKRQQEQQKKRDAEEERRKQRNIEKDLKDAETRKNENARRRHYNDRIKKAKRRLRLELVSLNREIDRSRKNGASKAEQDKRRKLRDEYRKHINDLDKLEDKNLKKQRLTPEDRKRLNQSFDDSDKSKRLKDLKADTDKATSAEKTATRKRTTRVARSQEEIVQRREIRELTKKEREDKIKRAQEELRKAEDDLKQAQDAKNKELKARALERRAEKIRSDARATLDELEGDMDQAERKRHQQLLDDAIEKKRLARAQITGSRQGMTPEELADQQKKMADRAAIKRGIDTDSELGSKRADGKYDTTALDSDVRTDDEEVRRRDAIRRGVEDNLGRGTTDRAGKPTALDSDVRTDDEEVRRRDAARTKKLEQLNKRLADQGKILQSSGFTQDGLDKVNQELDRIQQDADRLHKSLSNNAQVTSKANQTDWEKLQQTIDEQKRAARQKRRELAQAEINKAGSSMQSAVDSTERSRIAAEIEAQKKAADALEERLKKMSTGGTSMSPEVSEEIDKQIKDAAEKHKRLGATLERQPGQFTGEEVDWEKIDKQISDARIQKQALDIQRSNEQARAGETRSDNVKLRPIPNEEDPDSLRSQQQVQQAIQDRDRAYQERIEQLRQNSVKAAKTLSNNQNLDKTIVKDYQDSVTAEKARIAKEQARIKEIQTSGQVGRETQAELERQASVERELEQLKQDTERAAQRAWKELQAQEQRRGETFVDRETRTALATDAGEAQDGTRSQQQVQQTIKNEADYQQKVAEDNARREEEERIEREAKAAEQKARREAEEAARKAEAAERAAQRADDNERTRLASMTRYEANQAARRAAEASNNVEQTELKNQIAQKERQTELVDYKAGQSEEWADKAEGIKAANEGELRNLKTQLNQSIEEGKRLEAERQAAEEAGPKSEEEQKKEQTEEPKLDAEELIEPKKPGVAKRLGKRVTDWIGYVADYNPEALLDTMLDHAVEGIKDALKKKLKKEPAPSPDIERLVQKPSTPKPGLANYVQAKVPVVPNSRVQRIAIPTPTTQVTKVTSPTNPSKVYGEVDLSKLTAGVQSAIDAHLNNFAKTLDTKKLSALERKLMIDAEAVRLSNMQVFADMSDITKGMGNIKVTSPKIDIDAWVKDAQTPALKDSNFDVANYLKQNPTISTSVTDLSTASKTVTQLDTNIPEPKTQGVELPKTSQPKITSGGSPAPPEQKPLSAPEIKPRPIPSFGNTNVDNIKQATAKITAQTPGAATPKIDITDPNVLQAIDAAKEVQKNVASTVKNVTGAAANAKTAHKIFKANILTYGKLTDLKRKSQATTKIAKQLLAMQKVADLSTKNIRVIPDNARDNLDNLIKEMEKAGIESSEIEKAKKYRDKLDGMIAGSDDFKAGRPVDLKDIMNDVEGMNLAGPELDEILDYTNRASNSYEFKTLNKQKFNDVDKFSKYLKKTNPELHARLTADGPITAEKLDAAKASIERKAITKTDFKDKFLKKIKESLKKYPENTPDGEELRKKILKKANSEIPFEDLSKRPGMLNKVLNTFVEVMADKFNNMPKLPGKNLVQKKLTKEATRAAKSIGIGAKLAAGAGLAASGVGLAAAGLFLLMDVYDVYGLLIDYGVIDDPNEKIDADRAKIRTEIEGMIKGKDGMSDEDKKLRIEELLRDEKISGLDLRNWFGHIGMLDEDNWYNAMNDEMYREEYSQTESIKVGEGENGTNNLNIRNAGQLQLFDSNEKTSDFQNSNVINRDIAVAVRDFQELLDSQENQKQVIIYPVGKRVPDRETKELKNVYRLTSMAVEYKPNGQPSNYNSFSLARQLDKDGNNQPLGKIGELLNRIPDNSVIFLQDAHPIEFRQEDLGQGRFTQVGAIELNDILNGNIPDWLAPGYDSEKLAADKKAIEEFIKTGPVVQNQADYEEKMQILDAKIKEIMKAATGKEWSTEAIKKFDPLDPLDDSWEKLAAPTRSDAMRRMYNNQIDLARWDNIKVESKSNDFRLYYLQTQTRILREQINELKKAKYNITG